MTIRRTPGLVAVGVLLSVAACGGGGSKKASSSPGESFATANVPGVGTVVVDGRGRTVYVLTSGARRNVPCTDSNGCTAVWPDLSLPDGVAAAKAGAGLQGSALGTTKVGKENYPTYHGWLMYEYTGDHGSGQANGEGITSFGGTWYALAADGTPVKSSSGSSPAGSTYSGGYQP